MVIEVPKELKSLGEAMKGVLEEVERARAEAAVGGRAVDYAAFERTIAEKVAAVERGAHQVTLQALDVDRPGVLIEGKRYTRVERCEATYYTLAGGVSVLRSLFREVGVRNASVVDSISLRAGVVGKGWLPQTARAMAHLLQQGTSREAEQTGREVGRLPYCHSSFHDVGHELGELYVGRHLDVEDALIKAEEVPKEATSISVGVDRVSVPMEEPRPRPVGRPRKDAPRRPIARNFRMAYVGTVTIHDKDGNALRTLRYGRMPQGNARDMCDGLAGDVLELLHKRPDLKVVTLTDGAPEFAILLAEQFNETTLGVPVYRLVDFWHLLEKLGSAAQVTCGADKGPATVARWKLRLLNTSRAVEEILEELRRSGREHTRVGKEKPVHEAITYLENNGDRMNYALARRQGLPLGSGNTEATCKSLFEQRLKRSGARWKERTGEHVVQLRAVALSDRWGEAMSLTLDPLRKAVRPAA
jgi:hypothetical protein